MAASSLFRCTTCSNDCWFLWMVMNPCCRDTDFLDISSVNPATSTIQPGDKESMKYCIISMLVIDVNRDLPVWPICLDKREKCTGAMHIYCVLCLWCVLCMMDQLCQIDMLLINTMARLCIIVINVTVLIYPR